MKINVVTVQSGWVLQKIAQRMKSGNTNKDVDIAVSHEPSLDADVNYYVDLQNCYRGYKTKCDVAYFTHADKDSPDWARNLLTQTKAYSNLDGIISMNERYTEMLRKVGYPPEKLVTITPGETYKDFPLKKINIGVVSRGGWEGYGQHFLEGFFRTHKVDNFHFKFLGSGWEDGLSPIAETNNISMEFYSDEEKYPQFYSSFYHSIDYLLIPGMWTAGPMSMQEALSCGVPVIGADVGFVDYEFTADHTFPKGNTNALSSILASLSEPIIKRRAQVQDMRWEKYCSAVVAFCKKVQDDKFSK